MWFIWFSQQKIQVNKNVSLQTTWECSVCSLARSVWGRATKWETWEFTFISWLVFRPYRPLRIYICTSPHWEYKAYKTFSVAHTKVRQCTPCSWFGSGSDNFNTINELLWNRTETGSSKTSWYGCFGLRLSVIFAFTPAPGGTRVRFKWDFHNSPLSEIIMFVLALIFGSSFQSALLHLKSSQALFLTPPMPQCHLCQTVRSYTTNRS